MTRAEAPLDSKMLTLKVTLDESSPPIWRRFQTSDHMTLGDLHYALQIVMGWSNSHLHEFHIGRERYGTILPDDYDQEAVNDEEAFELREVLKRKGSKFKYVYDFGDYWMHEVVVEDISKPQQGVRYPVCIDGERRCPPEDCGGIDSYYDLLKILQDPAHEEYATYREWLPEGFNPDDFDVTQTNKELDGIDEWRRMAEGENEIDGLDKGPVARNYEEPVSRLLTLGEPQPELDYAALGMGLEHVPGLIQMATDMALHRAETESAEVWAPVHAWRALGQLRAEAAIEPLVELLCLVDEEQDYCVGEDLPKALGEIGASAIPAVAAFMQDCSRGLWARVAASESLSKIAQRHPEAREACVAALTAQLEHFSDNEEDLNAFLVSALLDLDAVESAPVMERAFAANSVDLSVQGDWEETQIELGLLDRRITPRPARGWLTPKILGVRRGGDMTLPQPHVGKKREKAKKKRKDQKTSRKKNRRK